MFIPVKYDRALQHKIASRYSKLMTRQREWDYQRRKWGFVGWLLRRCPRNPEKERVKRYEGLYQVQLGLKIGETVYLSHEEYVELFCTIEADKIATHAITADKITAASIRIFQDTRLAELRDQEARLGPDIDAGLGKTLRVEQASAHR